MGCAAELCGDSHPYVAYVHFGCSGDRAAFGNGDACCDTRTCGASVPVPVPMPAVTPTATPQSTPTPTPSPGVSVADCSGSCEDKIFTDSSHSGQQVCAAELCGDSHPYVAFAHFGCSGD